MFQITLQPEPRTKAAPAQSLVNPAWTAGLPTEDQLGWYAEADSDGLHLQLSKLEGESAWTIDAAFGRGSFPIFANGFGARYLLTKQLRADLGAQLDALVDELRFAGDLEARA